MGGLYIIENGGKGKGTGWGMTNDGYRKMELWFWLVVRWLGRYL